MARIKLDQESLGLSLILERIAHVRVKDSFVFNDIAYFIVHEGQVGKAIGKGAINLKKVQHQIQKKVRVIEYNDDVKKFAANVISPVRVEEILQENEVLIIRDSNKKTKGLLFGRDGKNLKMIERAVKRFFDVVIKIEG